LKYVDHPLIKRDSVEQRLYQETIVASAVNANTLIVLPTGLGKTVIAALVAAYRLHKYPNSKCVFLAPTRPLTMQHFETFKNVLNIPEDQFKTFTGKNRPEERVKEWHDGKVFFMTPQVLENDLIASRYTLENVCLIIFDEAHRAVGNYPYTFIAERYLVQSNFPLILGLTASPGSTKEKIEEICKNLHIENIELKTEKSPDVAPYIVPIKLRYELIKLPPEIEDIKKTLEKLINNNLKLLKEYGVIPKLEYKRVSKKQLLDLQSEIRVAIDESPTPNPTLLQASSLAALVLRLAHGLELLETQGLNSLDKYFDKIEKEATHPGAAQALKLLIASPEVKWIRRRVRELIATGINHPKLNAVKKIIVDWLKSHPESRIIVFTQYRDSAKVIVNSLVNSGIKAARFVGQADKIDDEGLNQKEQYMLLKQFSSGLLNVLVATSVAEEGLDIAECDLVIFYDCVPSAVRYIQRRGRTGRRKPGTVILLITKNTRDEGYYWAAYHREKEMKRMLTNLSVRALGKSTAANQPRLEKYLEADNLTIIVDHRESSSQVIKELINLNIKVKFDHLELADYIISDKVAVERKTSEDFLQSIIDQRLFMQLKQLKNAYETPILLIEGASLYGLRNMNPNAIRGALASVVLDYKIPILWSHSPQETARLLKSLLLREQKEKMRPLSVRPGKAPTTLKDMQEYVVSGLPGVDTALSKRLLNYFKTPESVFTATVDELKKVRGIGDKLANKIREVLSSEYEGE